MQAGMDRRLVGRRKRTQSPSGLQESQTGSGLAYCFLGFRVFRAHRPLLMGQQVRGHARVRGRLRPQLHALQEGEHLCDVIGRLHSATTIKKFKGTHYTCALPCTMIS